MKRKEGDLRQSPGRPFLRKVCTGIIAGAIIALTAVPAMASDYEIRFRTPYAGQFSADFNAFTALPEMPVLKKTKKSERLIDLKPFLFDDHVYDDMVFLRLKSGSVNHIKPELVMQAFMNTRGLPFFASDLRIKRLDLYTKTEDGLLALDEIGEEI